MYHRTGFVLATAAACAGLLGLTATAGAQTKVVYTGPPPGVGPIAAKFLPRSFAATNNPNINAFFRQRVTINVGDTVSFQLHGLHTVDLPGPSGSDLPLFAPQGLASGNKGPEARSGSTARFPTSGSTRRFSAPAAQGPTTGPRG